MGCRVVDVSMFDLISLCRTALLQSIRCDLTLAWELERRRRSSIPSRDAAPGTNQSGIRLAGHMERPVLERRELVEEHGDKNRNVVSCIFRGALVG